MSFEYSWVIEYILLTVKHSSIYFYRTAKQKKKEKKTAERLELPVLDIT